MPSFWCPGCKTLHSIKIKGENNSNSRSNHVTGYWEFNGDVNNPTFHPSILVTGLKRCHSFVTSGKIQFLDDCDHELAGKIVDLPDLPDWLLSERNEITGEVKINFDKLIKEK